MKKNIFDSYSEVQDNTNIDFFIPPNPGWNYVRLISHPEDNNKKYEYNCGKWLLFVPESEFNNVFRTLAKLVKEYKLTSCFKASGEPDQKGLHVFCIYCTDCSNISFVRKIAELLNSLGYVKLYGYKYQNGISAIFFKTDSATEYMSHSRGKSLTLFKYEENKQLYVKEFNGFKPSWKLVIGDTDKKIIENFQDYLDTLKFDPSDIE